MLEILQYKFMQNAIIASLFGGAGCGIIGVWIIMARIPFVGIAMSHAAFAGAIFGLLFGVNPLLMAIIFSVVSSALIGPITERSELEPNVSLGIIFSLLLGLAFLGMGLIEGPKTEALNFIWGNILLLSGNDLKLLIIVVLAAFVFLILLFKEIQAVLFNREIARAVGIPDRAIFYAMIFLSGMTVALSLNTIGGLLIFSLIINPPSAAHQITYNLKTMFVLSAVFGVCSCLLGLLFSYLFNVPSGAVIIIVSSVIFGISFVFSPKRKVKRGFSG
jgi:manganese/iron transport system permease protein